MSKRKNRQYNALRREKKAREETFYWEDLVTARDDVVNAAVKQQNLLMELVNNHKDIIDSNEELRTQVIGLMSSYADLAKDTVFTVSSLHTLSGEPLKENEVPEYKKGKISVEDEEYFEYLDIAYKYCTKSEQLANLSATGFLDIFLKIKEIKPEEDIGGDIVEMQQEINTAREEASKLPTNSEIQSVIDKEKNKSTKTKSKG